MNVRVIIGAIILVISALFLSTFAMMSGYEIKLESGWQHMPLALMGILVLVTLVMVFVSGFIMGRQYWKPATAYALLGAAVFALLALAGLHMTLGSPESVAMMEAMSVEEGVPALEARVAWATPLVLVALLAALGTILLLADLRQRQQAASKDVDPEARPLIVTVYAWFVIVTATMGALSTAWYFSTSMSEMRNVLAQFTPVSPRVLFVQTIVMTVSQVVVAVFLLRGRNWARWATLGIMLVGVLYMLVVMKQHSWLLPNLFWMGIAVLCLFVPRPVNAWFRRGRAGSSGLFA